MASLFGGLNIMSRAITASQAALNTVGHNVANASTTGYSRQSVNLVTSQPEIVYGGNGTMQVGSGVSIQSVTRARDTFIDRQYWKENSTLGYGGQTQDALSKIEGVFNEPSETGVQTVLNNFWQSWQTLSANASDAGARTTVRERGVELVDAITHADQQLRDMASDINSVIGIKVQNLNQITSGILSLNKQIVSIESNGVDHANDLRDRRDELVDELSKMTSVSVSEDQYGSYTVQAAGVTLVDADRTTELEARAVPGGEPKYGFEIQDVYIAGTDTQVNFTNGELGGLLEARDDPDSGIRGYLDQLDTMSKFLLQDFNAVHRSGYGTDGSTGNNFFGAAGTDYQTVTDTPQGGWVKELAVNPELFPTSSADCLDKIAAKTLSLVTKSNADSGNLTFGGKYDGTAASGSVTLRIKAVDASGSVTAAEVSTDGGATYSDATVDATTHVITLPNGVTAQIATNTKNAVNDTYTYTLPPQGDAAGDNAVLLGNRLKTDLAASLGNMSLDTFYSSFIGGLGVQSESAQRLSDNQQTLVDQISNWRESISGVNMDEEMTNMIRFQKGYNAAARVVTTMDEMLDKIINGMGTVGR